MNRTKLENIKTKIFNIILLKKFLSHSFYKCFKTIVFLTIKCCDIEQYKNNYICSNSAREFINH